MNPKSLPYDTTFTPVPDPLLGDLLNRIDSLAELKCILRALWHVHRKKAPLRCVTLGELSADPVLRNDMYAEEIEDAMNGAARYGIFAKGNVTTDQGRIALFVLNQEPHRAVLRQAVAGKLAPPQTDEDWTLETPKANARPNIFDLYEQEMGRTITPTIAEELQEAERQYPESWIVDAIRQAVLNEKRNWKYILAILERWQTEGKSDGKFGRNTKARDPRRYIKEYERRRGIPSRS